MYFTIPANQTVKVGEGEKPNKYPHHNKELKNILNYKGDDNTNRS